MLKYRLISSLFIVPAVLAAAFVGPPLVLFCIIFALAALGTVEFVALLEKAHLRPHRVLIGTATLLYLGGMYYSLQHGFGMGPDETAMSVLVVFVFGCFLTSVFQPESGNPMHGLFASLAALLYVPFLMGFFLLLLFDWPAEDGRLLLLYMLFVVKLTDVGAYFVGSSFGKHKLIPRVSPGKTWEGCAGGVAAALVTSLVFWWLTDGDMRVVHLRLVDAVVLGILLPVVGILGDLVESMLKRSADVKDSGTLIRGMGGILDVLDSLLFAGPALYLYAACFL